MVALLVRLKLTLLRNSLGRSVWRTVGLIIGLLYALGAVVMAIVGLVALHWTTLELTAEVTTVAFAGLTLGWLVFSLLVFGVDETVDPSKFALLPVRPRQLLPGLLLVGLIGSPGIATVLLALGFVAAWTRSVPLTLSALLVVPIGVATCVLFSRVGTAAFASALSSRRFRDLTFVALALSGAALGLAGNLFGRVASQGGPGLRTLLTDAATVLSWTPFGWVWAVPVDVARGQWAFAGLRLVLALGLVVVLWRAWEHFLGLRLTEPIQAGGAAGHVKQGRFLDRLYPPTPAGAIATRAMRYWRRDPRYIASVAGILIAPVIIVVSFSVNDSRSSEMVAFAPAIFGALVGMGLAQDLSYDGSAVWTHITTGVRGADDRTGRVMSTLTIYGPLVFVLLIACFVLSQRWDLVPVVVGSTAALTLIGLGAGAVVGTWWQWPAPPPGASPFQKGNSGTLPSLLSFAVSNGLTCVAALPTAVFVVLSFWNPWAGWVALVVGIASGLAALKLGVTLGGRILDRRWPEVLRSVSEDAA